MRDFSKKTLKALAAKGITILSTVAIPDYTTDMPWANASRGYSVNDKGCNRVLSHSEILEFAQ